MNSVRRRPANKPLLKPYSDMFYNFTFDEEQLNSSPRCSFVEDPAIKWPKKRSIDKYVNLMSDSGFKHVFGREANKEIIIAFLNEIIPDRNIVDIEHMRNEQMPVQMEKKKSVYDIYCKTDDGSRIVAEVQNNEQDDYIDRVLYYSCFPIQNQIEQGECEYTLYPVYIINIVNFKIPELAGRKEVLSLFRLKEQSDNTILSNKYTLIFIELPKFTKTLNELERNNILEGFYFCLKHISNLTERPLILQQEIMQKLFTAAQVAAMTEEEQAEYIYEMRTERDKMNELRFQYNKGLNKGLSTGLKKGHKEGLLEGQKKGRAEGRAEGWNDAVLETAKNFKLQNVPVDTIVKCTGLSEEVVKNL